MDVALITCAAMPGLAPDDRHLLAALRRRGLEVEPVVWEDPYFDWAEPAVCVIRSAWDYAYRRDEFVAWAHAAGDAGRLWNSARVVEWNTHKQYLCDLADRGVPVVPTTVLRAGGTVDLADALRARRWDRAMVKAAIAQTGRYAMHVTADHVARGQRHLDRLLPHEDMLLQPYLDAVATRGELSLTFIDGELTHAVRKLPAAGDFRVHDDHGGSTQLERPDAAALDVSRSALEAVGEPTLYARVDLVDAPSGRPMIMEFEIVEPELFLRFSEEALAKFVAAIERRLDRDAS